MKIADITAIDGRSKNLQFTEEVMTAGKSAGIEISYSAKDGKKIPAQSSGSAIRDENGKITGIVAIIRDITELKKAEEEIKKRERFFSGTLNGMLTFVALLDSGGRIIFTNNTPLAISGLKMEDIAGKMFHDAPWWQYSEETKQTIKKDIETCVAGKTLAREIECQMAGKPV